MRVLAGFGSGVFDINVRPRNMSVEKLQSGFLNLVKQLYSAKETRARRTCFWRRLRQARRMALPEPAAA